jgi:DSF synthase
MSLALNYHEASVSDDKWYLTKRKRFANLDVSIDSTGKTCLIALKAASPFSFTQSVLSELIECAGAARSKSESGVRNRVLLSNRPGVFSLGGDLTFFKDCISNKDSESLLDYANTAVEAIWESVTGSGVDEMVSVALVQGEAQGGGFEAALASHVLIAERGTWFGFPEGLFGLFPGMGAKPLLAARSCVERASKIIGSARRYTAEELHSEGIIDYLADPGCGMQMLDYVCGDSEHSQLLKLRNRFVGIDKAELIETVSSWVDLAMGLSKKHLRTIDYLIQAQVRARRAMPSIRLI